MTIAADSPPADSPQRKRQSRQTRQARVGILRNTNHPPRPPARKATLTGRWLSLRSSRRPPGEQVVGPASRVAQSPDGGGDGATPPAAALRHDDQGRLAGIDVAGLMASVAGLGTSGPVRTPYGAEIRPDLAPVAAAAPRARARSRADPPALEPEVPPAPAPSPASQFRRPRRPPLWPLLGGIALALVTLVLLPALLAL